MATTPLGNNSAMHPTLRMTWKRALKIERIARLSADAAGYSNEQIANFVGCDKQTVVLIRQLPAYHAKMMEIVSNITSVHDSDLRQNEDNMKDELRAMVPSSMMVIRNALSGKLGAGLQYKAALEVMDRDGTNAKVSRSSVSVEVKPALAIDANVASNLMQLLTSAPSSNAPVLEATPFTTNAQEALSQQVTMADDNTEASLEALDLSGQTPN